jgi:hypothetical protein
MKQISRSRINKAYAAVASLTIFAIVGLESYALSQGVNGSALTAALAAIAGIGGAGIGRLLK